MIVGRTVIIRMVLVDTILIISHPMIVFKFYLCEFKILFLLFADDPSFAPAERGFFFVVNYEEISNFE